ncbi:restriction endonuclease subunit S [Rhodanobacter sp. BL-MT-08]
MASEIGDVETWEWVPLSELTAANVTYGVVQPGVGTPTGTPMLRVNNFSGHSLNVADVMRIDASIEAKYQRTRLQPGDVLITIVGSVGLVAVVPDAQAGWNIARAIALIRPRHHLLSRWIAFVLRSPVAQHQLGTTANTTVQTTINLKDLRALSIPFPPESTRAAISDMLVALDDRIDLLRQTNTTLEAIAQTLFKSWFVDFDPVRAKAEGREPEGMDAATAALFPNDFEESELGLIPKGWRVRSLDSFATYLNGLALQRFPPESDSEYLPVIKIAQLRAGHTLGADRASARLKPDYIVRDGDVLFSWSGSLEVEFWCGGDGALNQHLFKITSGEVPNWFCYQATKHFLPSFRETAANKATTMGHIQRRHLTEARLALPSSEFLNAVSPLIGSLLDKRVCNALQAREIASLRDTLLPRLISGKLRLPEAEAAIAEAVA